MARAVLAPVHHELLVQDSHALAETRAGAFLWPGAKV